MRSLVLALALCTGCETQFHGSAHISADACTQKCAAVHMNVGGIVYLGEYSSACVCEVPGAAPAVGTRAIAAAITGPAVAVTTHVRDSAAATSAAAAAATP